MLFGVNLEVKDLTLVATNYVNNVFIHGKARVRVEASVWVSKGRVTTSMHGSKVFYYIKLLCPFVSVHAFFSTRPSNCNQIWHACADRSENHSSPNKFDPPHPRVSQGCFRGSTIQKSRKCHDVPRKSIKNYLPPRGRGWVGVSFRGQHFKSWGNIMNCREN